MLDDDRLIVDAALQGAGLAYAFERQVAAELAAGQVVRVLEDWCPSFPGFYWYYPSRRLTRPVLRAFVDFLKEWAPFCPRSGNSRPDQRVTGHDIGPSTQPLRRSGP